MGDTWQQELFTKYPKIFRQKDLPMQETCMCFGIETGPGWVNILDSACALIQWHVDQSRKSMASYLRGQRAIKRAIRTGTIDEYAAKYWERTIEPYKSTEIAKFKSLPLKYHTKPKLVQQVEATQIKEKFGTLRFYTTATDDYIEGILRMAETMSAVTCEKCGKPGKIRGGGWLSCRCDDCCKDEEFGKEVL